MSLFSRFGRRFDVNSELGRVVARSTTSAAAEKASMLHLASILRTIGPTGDRLKVHWPAELKVKVHTSSYEFVQKWFGNSDDRSEARPGALSSDLKLKVDEISTNLALADVEHPYEAAVLASVEELLRRKSHGLAREVILEIVETGLTFVVSQRWAPFFLAESHESFEEQLSFANVGSLQVHADVISRVTNDDEVPLNAGVSYMLNQGASGDGTLIVTNRRLVFSFDEDYQKEPQSIFLQSVRSFSMVETSVVPMSKELTIEVGDREQVQSVSFYVGDYFSIELTKLFRKFGVFRA
jgi:hypothetical protein